MSVSYLAVTVHGRRIVLPDLETFDGAPQVGGGMPEQDGRMRKIAEGIYGHLLKEVVRVIEESVQ